MIDRYSPEKIYVQIANAIESDIQSAFEPGDMYLSEKIMTEKYAVNRHTVRRAVEELVKQGVLEKRHGLGTFIAEKKMAYRIREDQRFTETLQLNGLEVESILLEKKAILAHGGIAEKLQINQGDHVFQIDTLRKVEGNKVALISHFFTKEVCPKVLATYESGSLGEFIKAAFSLQPQKVSSLISVASANSKDSCLLGVVSHQPIMKVKTINKDIKTGKRIEYSITRFRSDMIQLEILMSS